MVFVSYVKRERVRHIYSWVSQFINETLSPSPDTVATAAVNRILRAAQQRGVDRYQLLQKIGLDEYRLRNPLSRLSLLVVIRLFRQLEIELGSHTVPIVLSRIAAPRSFSDPSFMAMTSANLQDIIQAFVNMQAMRQGAFTVEFDIEKEYPQLAWTRMAMAAEMIAPFVEYSVSAYFNLSQLGLGQPMRLHKVMFQHAPRFDVSEYEKLFGCPVVFGAHQTRIEMQYSQLLAPAPGANEKLREMAIQRYRKAFQYLEAGKKLSANSFLYLWIELDKSPLSIARMAGAFGMTERSLRRRLVNEGTPFRQLLDEVRKDLWDLYSFEGSRNLSDIAQLLGYSTLSAFTRAHRRWYGQPPSEF